MKVNIEIRLKPFNIPHFVVVDGPTNPREKGLGEGRKLSLRELDTDTLSRMCNDFRKGVFKRAGKQEPPTAV
jgi:hypothetical protein